MNEQAPLSVKNLSARHPGQNTNAIENITYSLKPSCLTGVIGPNGAGKSTLLKAILGLIKYDGDVSFFGSSFKDHQKKIAYIPQRSTIDWDFPVTALDVCLMGLYPKIGWFKSVKKKHKEEAMSYLEKVDLAPFASQPIGKLSGGQQQRVFMARALAQKADLFLLDEPMAGVDQTTQDILFDVFKTLTTKEYATILMIHHNLEAARTHFDHVILLNKKLIAAGRAESVLTQDNINQAYGPMVA